MKRHNIWAGLAVTGAAALLLSACSGGSGQGASGSSDGSGTVTVVTNADINSKWIQAVIPLFEEKYPNITVEQNAIEGDTLLTTATNLYASSSAPDVGFIQTNYPGYASLISEGALTQVDDVWASSGMEDATAAATLSHWTVDDHQYGVASYQVWAPVIYYNTDMFDQAHIEVPDDHVLDEDTFLEMVDKLKAANMQPLSVGGAEYGGYHVITGLLQTNNTDVADYEIDLTNTQPGSTESADYAGGPMLDALNTVKEWSDDGVFANGAAGLTVSQAQSLFAAGGAAMLTGGSWDAGIVTESNPDLNFDWFMYPSFASDPLFLAAADNGMAIPSAAKNPVGAHLFLEFLASKEAQGLVSSSAGSIPIRTDLSTDALTGLAPQVAEQLQLQPDIGASEFWLPSATVTDAVTVGFGQILIGEKTPAEVAELVQAAAEESRGS